MIIHLERSESSAVPELDRDNIQPFPNLRSPLQELASHLEPYRNQENLIVLGIALGGMPLAHEVAKYLQAPLDLIILRRLLAPDGPGSQVCAANVAGRMVLPDEILPLPEAPSSPFEYFVADALSMLERRMELCRRLRQPVKISDQTVILVDCGSKTGLTMQAALQAVRTQKPARIIATVPVASVGARKVIGDLADEVICLASPQPFGNVALWYKDFTRPGDEHVADLFN